MWANRRGRTADKRQVIWTGAACVFLPAAGGGHGARCIEYAILGALGRRAEGKISKVVKRTTYQ